MTLNERFPRRRYIDMSDTGRGGFISKAIGPKRRWRAYKARVKQLPENYRAAADAIEHYLMHFVPRDDDRTASEFEDLVHLFEQAATDGVPIHGIVGDDPVEFAETFAKHYTKGGYAPDRARERLIRAVKRAGAEEEGTRS